MRGATPLIVVSLILLVTFLPVGRAESPGPEVLIGLSENHHGELDSGIDPSGTSMNRSASTYYYCWNARTVQGSALPDQLWRAWASGRFERVFLEFLQGHMAGPEGSSKPLASPDGQYIAFAADYGHGLWKIVLCDLASGETWDFVDPDEYGGRGQSSELLITAWSPDSRELLYHVTTFDLDDPYRDYIERFFCARNIHTHENRTLVFPGKFDCWLPAGSFLVTRDGLPCVWDSAEDSIRNVTPSSRGGYFRQLTCDHSGQFLLANYCPTQYDRFSQIVRVDVSSGAVAAVSEVGEWARYQFPSSSPSGGHVAYMVMAGTLPLPTRTLVVDGRDMRVCRSYKWIDDDRIVVLDFDVLLVLDIHTGRVVGATQLAAE